MIEGARLLPWFQEAQRSRPAAVKHYTDCQRCMKTNDLQMRQSMGCGYEPALAGAQPWRPDGFERGRPVSEDDPLGRHERDPEVCVGYVVSMREVIEASRARLHWEKGTLREWCMGSEPTPGLLLALEELECESSAMQAHRMEQAGKGGKS